MLTVLVGVIAPRTPPARAATEPGPPATITFEYIEAQYPGFGRPYRGRVLDAAGAPVADGTPVRIVASGTGTEQPADYSTATRSGFFDGGVAASTTGQTTLRATAGAATGVATMGWVDPKFVDLRLILHDPWEKAAIVGNETIFSAEIVATQQAATGVTVVGTVPEGSTITSTPGGRWTCSTIGRRATCHRGPLRDMDAIWFAVRTDRIGPAALRFEISPDNGPDGYWADNVGERSAEIRPAPDSVGLTRAEAQVAPAGAHTLTATAAVPDGTLAHFSVDGTAGFSGAPFVAMAPTPAGDGYWLLQDDGRVGAYGAAPDLGGVPGQISAPAVAIRSTPSGQGFLVASAAGEVIARGDGVAGSPVSLPAPVTGLALTRSGAGYWLVDAEGNVATSGDATFHGALGAANVRARIGGIETSPGGAGYWLWSTRYDVYPFGDAPLLGGAPVGGVLAPMAAMAPTPENTGYLLIDAVGVDTPFGGVYSRSASRRPVGPRIVAAAAAAGGTWLLGADGSVLTFGDAPFLGPRTVVPFSAGTATVPVTAYRNTTHQAVAWVDRPGGVVASAPLSIEWRTSATLVVSTETPQASTTFLARVRATLFDDNGRPVPDGRTVQFSATGTGGENSSRATATTSNGGATFTFTSTLPGTSTVTATVGGRQASTVVNWRYCNCGLLSEPLHVAPPALVWAEAGDRSARVSWIESEGSAVLAYEVRIWPNRVARRVGAATTAVTVDGLDNGRSYQFTVTSIGPDGPGRESPLSNTVQPHPPGSPPPNPGSGETGYWMVSAAGVVYAFGAATDHGQPELPAGVEAVDLEPTPTARGYWVVDSTGVVHPFGDARPYGDLDRRLLAPDEAVTSLSATPAGDGYWLFTTRGRVVPFGAARSYGDLTKVTLAGPVLDSIPTPSGQGYYMVASDGGIFAFGDARFVGSMGGRRLNKPVQSLVPDSDGKGYWLVASDGGIFAFDAPFRGSLGGIKLNKPVVGMVRYGDGYLMVGADGGIFNFSNLAFSGSLGDKPPASAVVAVAALPTP